MGGHACNTREDCETYCCGEMLSSIMKFIALVGAIAIILSVYDGAAESASTHHLRRSGDGGSTTAVAAEARDRRILKETKTRCSNFGDVDACTSNKDENGNDCQWCSDPTRTEVCVTEESIVYKFAPCNMWLCYNAGEPEKSDPVTCVQM